MTTHTTADYLAAIRRELAKRAATYPKIIQKMQKKGTTPRRIQNELTRQRIQTARLSMIYNTIAEGIDYLDPASAHDYLTELNRELKMRSTVYKRFVIFRRITPEAAESETAVWRSLCTWWQENYI